ncbi:hypothetical protein ACFWBC_10930 [Streptomyces sp. NPDC059985]|uniref:hypothetical protein n=1 Tax=Streptomyces sp. NPDC059985 TaxID=3347025 RepID=UPI0036B38890
MTALVRLYPAGYRREFGEEIAHAYREAIEGAGRTARLREAGDVAGHALRMRLGLGSAGRAGRFLAAVAPFAVLAVGVHALSSTELVVAAFTMGGPVGQANLTALWGPGAVAALVGALLALTGRWGPGAWTALAGSTATFAAQAFRPGMGLEFAAVTSGPVLLLALLPALCPPDLRPTLRLRTATTVAGVLAATAVLTVASARWQLPYPLDGLRAAVPVAAGLLSAGRPAFARLRTAPAVLVAGLPLVALVSLTGAPGALVLPGALGLLLAAAAAVSVHRRRRGSRPSL